MVDNNHALAIMIKNKIQTHFINAGVNIIFDKERNEYFISTRNRDLYYSQAYGILILEINQNTLWGRGIFNFYFTLDEKQDHLEKMAEQTSFDRKESKHYEMWGVHNTHILFVDNHVVPGDYSLAA